MSENLNLDSATDSSTVDANVAIDKAQNGEGTELNPQGQSVAAKKVLTKEEKIEAIDKQIEKLQARRAHLVEFGTEPAKAVKAGAGIDLAILKPGTQVEAYVGRKTANTDRRLVVGTVVAVKPPMDNTPAQVRITVGEGFDFEVFTVYPASITKVAGAGVTATDDTDAADGEPLNG